MTMYETVDAYAIKRLREIHERYNTQHIVGARMLDFKWRKDGREGIEQADAIKDLLRYLPALIHKAEADVDPDYKGEPGQAESAAVLATRPDEEREG